MFKGAHDSSSRRVARRLRFVVIGLIWAVFALAVLPIAATTIPAATAHRNSPAPLAAPK